MSTAVTPALVAFGADAWAFRAPQRAIGRDLVLATLAAALAGAQSERVAIAAGGAGGTARLRARAIGRPEVTTPLRAALLTGLAAGEVATLATPVVCAALAIGESVDAPGATVLDAIVAGAEIAARIERALGAGHLARGWDTRGTCGRAGAAVAVARVLSLPREALRNALGIAITAASGLREAAGTMTAALIVGMAAADGVEAALLARAEFSAAPRALEGRRGLAALTTSTFDADAAVAGLGERFISRDLAMPAEAARVPDAVRMLVERLERLPSITALIDATMSRA